MNSKRITKKGQTKKRQNNRQANSSKNWFIPGNKAAEIWTEATVLPKLEAIWKTLTTDKDGKVPSDGNIVQVNKIKLLGEVCLMHKITRQRWNEWKAKFTDKSNDIAEKNNNYSEKITELMDAIKWLLECRLNYSTTVMDIFILKNFYGYKDQQQVDATTKGESLNDNLFFKFLKETSMLNKLEE